MPDFGNDFRWSSLHRILSIGTGSSSTFFAVSSASLPANLIVSPSKGPITIPNTYAPQIIAQTTAGSLTATISVIVSPAISGKVVTHLYNNQRTGWNSTEVTLNTANVASSFGLLNSVTVDEQVDAQPLLVAMSGGDDQVYVATENNTIYRIDATTGAILQSRNLGTPVPDFVPPWWVHQQQRRGGDHLDARHRYFVTNPIRHDLHHGKRISGLSNTCPRSGNAGG